MTPGANRFKERGLTLANKIFAIGDIHGCHHKLVTLLSRLPFDEAADTLVFLGDYINRGPDSRKVIETLLELEAHCAHVVFLKGNHEQALLEYTITGEVEDFRLLRIMGAEATATSYNATLRQLVNLSCIPPAHQQFLHNLKFSYSAGNYLFTHADYAEPQPSPPGWTTEEGAEAQRHFEAMLLASRRLAREELYLHESVVVFGHLPFSMPLVKVDRIGIDTGAVFGNMLTAVELPDLRFYHA